MAHVVSMAVYGLSREYEGSLVAIGDVDSRILCCGKFLQRNLHYERLTTAVSAGLSRDENEMKSHCGSYSLGCVKLKVCIE